MVSSMLVISVTTRLHRSAIWEHTWKMCISYSQLLNMSTYHTQPGVRAWWNKNFVNFGEFTSARVLEDYHKNPLCHHSKLNAVFKSFQRFLQNKNEPGSQSSRSYSIHSLAFLHFIWLTVWCKEGLCSNSIKVDVTSCYGFICVSMGFCTIRPLD